MNNILEHIDYFNKNFNDWFDVVFENGIVIFNIKEEFHKELDAHVVIEVLGKEFWDKEYPNNEPIIDFKNKKLKVILNVE